MNEGTRREPRTPLSPTLQRMQDRLEYEAASFDRLQDELDVERDTRVRWMAVAWDLMTVVQQLRAELARETARADAADAAMQRAVAWTEPPPRSPRQRWLQGDD